MSLVADSNGAGAAEPTPPEALRWEFFLQQGVRPIRTFVRRRQGQRVGHGADRS